MPHAVITPEEAAELRDLRAALLDATDRATDAANRAGTKTDALRIWAEEERRIGTLQRRIRAILEHGA